MNATDYFQAYSDYFWQWEEQATIIAVPGERTIAYKSFVREFIEMFAPQGLPPFGSLLLALIATNPGGGASLDVVYRIVSDALKTTDDATLARAISFLKLLSEVPRPYREGTKRVQLLQVLFERCHNILSLDKSRAICDDFKNDGYDLGEVSVKKAFSQSEFNRDFRTISLLGNQYESVDDIIRKIAGLPDQQFEIEFEQKPGDAPAALDLVDALINDYRSFTVGSLIRWLWGGLNIPVHSALPSQQPLGGISDLTNKGDYDKLLISEFANDDLFFLSRLANNEALYIHREIPPANNNLQRVILIDASLKNWGTPKAIAFAVMLAIARHPKTDIACAAFVLGGDTCHPVSIESIHTIIDALQIVEGALHAAGSLAAFLKEHAADKNKEVFFITESSTLKQAPLLKVMNEYHRSINYLVLTDADGNIDVYKKHQNSKKHVQHIRLPLENLWKRQPPGPKPEVNNKEGVHVAYPILLRDPGRTRGIISAPDGEIFQVAGDRSLLRFFDKEATKYARGWDLLYRNLPIKPDICEIGISGEGHYVLLLFNTSNREIFLLNISTGEKRSVIFDQWKSAYWRSFIFDTGRFLHLNGSGAWSISVDGSVEPTDTVAQERFTARTKALEEIVQKYSYGISVFKNINRVFVNAAGELVFNSHSLELNKQHNHIKLVSGHEQKLKVAARKNSASEFLFDDGSVVEVNRCGMLILRSSDKAIPAIYIPTSLDSNLGVATAAEFAGNEYYFKEPLYDVTLMEAGANKLNMIKIVTEITHRPLQEIQDIINDNGPLLLLSRCLKNKAMHMKGVLEKHGGVVLIIEAKGQDFQLLKKTGPTIFFEKYIRRFINTIQRNHGTTDHATP